MIGKQSRPNSNALAIPPIDKEPAGRRSSGLAHLMSALHQNAAAVVNSRTQLNGPDQVKKDFKGHDKCALFAKGTSVPTRSWLQSGSADGSVSSTNFLPKNPDSGDFERFWATNEMVSKISARPKSTKVKTRSFDFSEMRLRPFIPKDQNLHCRPASFNYTSCS